MRQKYPDAHGQLRKLRVGKMVAQGAHASAAFLCDIINSGRELTYAEELWIGEHFVKVCVGVDTEEELRALHAKALEMGITANLIVDSGYTEFHGQPTVTALGLGPDWAEILDPLTGNLELL